MSTQQPILDQCVTTVKQESVEDVPMVADEKFPTVQHEDVAIVPVEGAAVEVKTSSVDAVEVGPPSLPPKVAPAANVLHPPESKPPAPSRKRRARVQIKKALDYNVVIERVGNVVDERACLVGAHTGELFKFSECISLNDFGDVRYSDCTLNTAIGSFRPLDNVKIIDWLASSSTMMVSKTGKVVDSVLFAITPASVNVTPIPMPSDE
jgi:hypothetical protein